MIHLPPYLVVALAASSQHSARVAFGPTMGLPRRCGPPIGLTPPPAAVDALASDVDGMDEMALKLVEASDDASKFRPTRGADGRLEPVLTLPGDTLETTPFMGYVTAASTILTLMVVVRAFVMSTSALWPILGVAMGGFLGELFSGCFHWATDNYGSLKTPVVGFACAAFQGHHLAPWTISHRTFPNNVYKIASATIPLIAAVICLLPPIGAATVAVMFYLQLVAQEFHRWTHTPPSLLPAWKKRLQRAGLALPMQMHIAHHKPPFDKHYCILTGRLNPVLDSSPIFFWRRLEAFFFRLNGQEPLSWKDPKVKELALSL